MKKLEKNFWLIILCLSVLAITTEIEIFNERVLASNALVLFTLYVHCTVYYLL